MRDSAQEARGKGWTGAECTFPAEQHRHCTICWWELYRSDDPERGSGFRAGDDWLCAECHGRFIIADELGLAAV